ncbi:hypothetical protein GEMRC1_012104 [Eukaryota sp. GEM-RC1]
MLTSIYKEHQANISHLKSSGNTARRQASKTAEELSKELHTTTHEQVVKVFEQQKLIEKEISNLCSAATQFVRQSDTWATQAEKLHNVSKDLEDVAKWQSSTEDTARSILRMLRNIAAKHDSQS